MEIIIQLIFVVALLKFCLKAALSDRFIVIFGYGLAMAIVAFALYPIVINQPLTVIGDMLASRSVVENIALITTAESILGVLISIYLLNNYFRPRQRRTKWAKAIKIVPGVISLVAVGYFELIFFKMRVGGDFLTTALLYSSTIFVAIVGVALLLRYIIDGESLRLELKLILNLAILVLGLLVSSSVAEYNQSNAQAKIEWGALIAIILGSATLVGVGVWLHKINFTQKLTHFFKWNR